MTRMIISTQQAPAAIGPYSQAVRHGDTVYLSGQIALDPTTGDSVRLAPRMEARPGPGLGRPTNM